MEIKSGTTPTISINLNGFNLEKVIAAKLTFSSSKMKNNVILIKTKDDMEMINDVIEVKLSEQDTIMLNSLNLPQQVVYAQLRLKDTDNELYKSDIVEISVDNLLDGGVFDEQD